jgi:hypothetical protein
MSRAPWTPKQIASLLGNSAAAVTLEGSSFTIPTYQVRLCVVFLFFFLFFLTIIIVVERGSARRGPQSGSHL